MNVFVTEYDEVVENVKQFNTDLAKGKDVEEQLSQFKHWYYIAELDQFGPSKFIGYKGMTSEDYNFGYGKSGIDTEKILKKWFRILDEDDRQYTPLWVKISDMIDEFRKNLRKNAKIHVIK